MEIVLERLESMKDGHLNISNLGLTKLPKSKLWEKVIFLNCSNNQLTILPKLSNIEILYCENNQLIELPKLTSIKTLYCFNNKLTNLPELPNVRNLYCYINKLSILNELPKVEILFCSYNHLTELPELPLVKKLFCNDNLLKFRPEHYKFIHQIRKVATILSVVKQWRKFNLLNITDKKQGLHNELLYSPNLPFYKDQLKAQHWFKQLS